MLTLRQHFLALLLGAPLLLPLGACAPESTDGTVPEPGYGVGGVTVTPSGTDLNEQGADAQLTVVLDSPPRENVTFVATLNRPTEALFTVNGLAQSSAELTFTPDNWNTPQTFSIVGQNDNTIEAADFVEVTVAFEVNSSDPAYSNPTITLPDPTASTLVFRNYDSTPTDGIASFATSGTVTELLPNQSGYQEATFPIQLTSRPQADVVVTIDLNSAAAESLLSVSPSSLTITPENWTTAQTLRISALREKKNASDQSFTLPLQIQSSDPYFNKSFDLQIVRIDADTPGLFFVNDDQPTSEEGDSVQLGIRLRNQPSSTVSVEVTSTDLSEGVVSGSPLTFTTSNWETPQFVTVTGQADNIADGDTPYELTFRFSGPDEYQNLNLPSKTVVNLDADQAGLRLSLEASQLSESGDCGYLAVRLNTRPQADVTLPETSVRFSSSEAAEASTNSVCANATQISGTCQGLPLTFTSTNWNQTQLLCIQGEDDDVIDGTQSVRIEVGALQSNDSNYDGLSASVQDFTFTNADNDYAGVRIDPLQFVLSKGFYQLPVQLRAEPAAPVTVRLADSVPSNLRVLFQNSSISFNPSDWNQPQTFDLTAGTYVEGTVDFVVESTDDRFDATLTRAISLRTDNSSEAAGFELISTKANDENFTSESGDQLAFRLKLRKEPSHPVIVTLESDNIQEGNPDRLTLTLDSSNWSEGEEIIVSGQDDSGQDDNVPYQIQFTSVISSDPDYDEVLPQNLLLVNRDNDSGTVAPLSETTFESDYMNRTCGGFAVTTNSNLFEIEKTTDEVREDSAQATAGLKVRLAQAISGTVTLRAASGNDSEGELLSPTGGSVYSRDLTFNANNWNLFQDLTVRGVNDAIDDGNQPFAVTLRVLATSEPDFVGESASVCLVNLDDDTAGIELNFGAASQNLLITSEPDQPATLQVRLLSEPTGDVVLQPHFQELTGKGSYLDNDTPLTFDASNWNLFQSIKLVPRNDNDTNPLRAHELTFTNSAFVGSPRTTDSHYQDIIDIELKSIPGYQQDEDVQDLLITLPESTYVNESGSSQTFEVRLRSQPSGQVLLPLSVDRVSEGRVSPTMLVFDSATWNDPRTVRVSGVDDYTIDRNQQFTVTIGKDGTYLTKDRKVRFINLNTTEAGFLISVEDEQSDEAGGDARITVRLKSKPAAEVVLSATSSDQNKAVVVEGQNLSFDQNNWSYPQTIRLVGLTGGSTPTDQDYLLNFSRSSSRDNNYDGLMLESIPLRHLDMDGQ